MSAPAGPTPLADRSPAPDLARGGMLLLIALANVHTYLLADGLRSYPAALGGVDRVVVLLQMLLVDGRAYPLFALLFGYGVTQLAWRRAAQGRPAPEVERIVRRRGTWMVAIGFAHAVLLFSGDIVGAYGLVAVALAGALVRGRDATLQGLAAGGTALGVLLGALAGLRLPPEAAALRSVAVPDAGQALVLRLVEWLSGGFVLQALSVFGMVALGAWAARRRMLDDPAAHRRLLVRVAVAGIGTGLLLGLPFALAAAGLWAPSLGASLAASAVHTLGGYAAGAGYAALFGLLALRGPGPVGAALAACGRRSLSCYLAQSVAFVALLPAWTLGLGAVATVWQAALLGLGTWLVVLGIAVASERAGYRGPAEVLLRRLTYGRPPVPPG
ncbi:MAG: DUF418 domain-containing protein [Pseudonocardiales bacterium]|nr:DUF418 domain-containing protein [Pseudonocardiales bacterium]